MAPFIVQVNYMNIKKPLTPFLANWRIKKKYCKIVVDEIHIKPTIRYQENNIICYSHHKPSKPARTVLAIMIASIMRATVFVRGLIPVHSVKYELLFDQTSKL